VDFGPFLKPHQHTEWELGHSTHAATKFARQIIAAMGDILRPNIFERAKYAIVPYQRRRFLPIAGNPYEAEAPLNSRGVSFLQHPLIFLGTPK
jgi:hypothetical protein